jgi:ubiquinone biosynthesis accessory factor UbiJ
MMIKNISLQALQFAINQAIQLDKDMVEKLYPFDHKIIEVLILPLGVRFYLRFFQGIIYLNTDAIKEPDTIIHTSPLGLIRLSFLPSSKMRSLFNDNIRISGDLELGQALKKVFDEMDIDWEGHLAHFTGDVAAFQIGKVLRKGLQFQEKCVEHLRQSTKAYLIHEVHMTPSKLEIDEFCEDVDELRLRAERLLAHAHYLQAKHDKS